MGRRERCIAHPRSKIKEAHNKKSLKNYMRPTAISMAEFSSRTALGVSPAMKKKENYIISVLF